MRQRVDFADFGGKRRVEQVAVRQALAFDQHAQGVGIAEEIQLWGIGLRLDQIR